MNNTSESPFGGTGFDLFGDMSLTERGLFLFVILAECFIIATVVVFPLWTTIDYFRHRNSSAQSSWTSRFGTFVRLYMRTSITVIVVVIAASFLRESISIWSDIPSDWFLLVALAVFPLWVMIDFARTRLSPQNTTWSCRFGKFLRLYLCSSVAVIFFMIAVELHSHGIPPITLEAKFRRAVWTKTISEKFPASYWINVGTVRTSVVVECRGWKIERAIESNFAGKKNWRVRDPHGDVRWWGSKEDLKRRF